MICGIDEAGRGEVIGPLVVAGVLINESNIQKLVEIGVKDSKMLSRYERQELYPQIIDIVDSYHIIFKSAQIVDRYVQYHKLDTLEAETFASIARYLKPDQTIVDSPGNPKKFGEIVSRLSNTKISALHKADKNFACVSSAAILAKVSYDNIIKIIQKYHPVGSGATSDTRTRDFLQNTITRDTKLPFVRYTWSTIRNITKSFDNSQSTLDSFG